MRKFIKFILSEEIYHYNSRMIPLFLNQLDRSIL
jgi:hypothetical protein